MFFDDRLATVLRQRAQSDVSRRTQFRQLLDILGSERMGQARAYRDNSLVASAWLRMDALAEVIPAGERARMIREPGWRFRNPELAAHLASYEPDVASAALNRAQLPAEDWNALIPRLPVRARGFLRLRRDLPVDVEKLLERLGVHDRGLPSPTVDTEARNNTAIFTHDDEPDTDSGKQVSAFVRPSPAMDAPVEKPAPSPDPTPGPSPVPKPVQEGRSEISAIVERIAQFKRDREQSATEAQDASQTGDNDNPLMPRLPLGEAPLPPARKVQAFGFAADTAGRIEWADTEVARMVIGARLVPSRRIGVGSHEGPLVRPFTRRQPIISTATTLDGADAISGDWIVDAQPRFTDGGHFAGYVGRFRRPPETAPAGPGAAEREADRIRQLLHELRTPVTAVQGYAEIIQQELFGSAPHEYRGLAAAIAADAARILAGFEELDRLAKLETDAIEVDEGAADLGAMARTTTSQLAQVLAPRMAGIDLEDAADDAPVAGVAVEPDHLEAMLWRILATLGGGCAAGEMLKAEIETDAGSVRLVCDLPAQLLEEEDIFTAEAKPIGSAINAGLFGAGFALRLARAEARAAGGSLIRDGERIALTLPALGDELVLETEADG